MPSFSDKNGRQWIVEINVGAVKRVRSTLSVDLANLTAGDPPLLTRLGTDYVLICDVLFVLCKPQADAAGVTDEEFGEAMGGSALQAGLDALMGALADFFQSLGRTETVRMLNRMRTVIDAAVKLAEAKIEAIEIPTSGSVSTNAPGSSG